MTDRTFLRKLLTTPDFFNELAWALDNIFPSGWIDFYDDGDVFCAVGGTVGFANALKSVCEKLHLNDCFGHYDQLDWLESDILDNYILVIFNAIVFDEYGKRV